MHAEIEATGLVGSSHREDAEEQAARPAIGDHGAAVAHDTDLPGARLVVPNQLTGTLAQTAEPLAAILLGSLLAGQGRPGRVADGCTRR
jgi:hypothetical protein